MAYEIISTIKSYADKDYYVLKYRQFYDNYIDNFDPWFFTKPQEFKIFDQKVHYYKPFHFKLIGKTYEENPSLVTSIFLTMHAAMNFFSFLILAFSDSFLSLFQLTSTPIGEVRRISLKDFKENKKATFLRTFIDEIGKNSRDAYIHSAKDFQKALAYFPVQIPNLEIKKIFESEKLFLGALPLLKGWMEIKKIGISALLWTANTIDSFSPSTAMKLEIKHFSKLLEEIDLNNEIILKLHASEDLASSPVSE